MFKIKINKLQSIDDIFKSQMINSLRFPSLSFNGLDNRKTELSERGAALCTRIVIDSRWEPRAQTHFGYTLSLYRLAELFAAATSLLWFGASALCVYNSGMEWKEKGGKGYVLKL